jgi:predicted NAD/FAD-binding protein
METKQVFLSQLPFPHSFRDSHLYPLSWYLLDLPVSIIANGHAGTIRQNNLALL